MKKTLAILLTLVMIVALMPAAFADVTGISVSADKSILKIISGGTADTCTVTATLTGDLREGESVSWTSSNTSVATVTANADSKATVTAAGAGETTITATVGAVSGTCTVSVVVPVTGITVSLTNTTVAPGGTSKASAVITPSDATNKNVAWSSDTTGVTVDTEGNITVASGTTATSATITATAADGCGATGTATLTIANGAVTGVTVTPETLTLGCNDTGTLTAKVSPTYATNQGVTWESNTPGVANVNSSGVVTSGTTTGTATITAKSAEDASIKDTCTVTVATISLDKTTLTVAKGTTSTALQATVAPSGTPVTWTSSNESVATVSSGAVTGVSAGTATIYAKVNGSDKVVATCTVTVTSAVTGVELDLDTLDITGTGSGTLKATIYPADATDKTLIWTSSDTSVATVTGGTATNNIVPATVTGGSKAGTATITVKTKDGNYTDTCTVRVSSVAVTGITLSKTSSSVAVNGTETLSATVSPSNASNKSVVWSTSNSSVATVSNGVVTGVGSGSAVITATAADGSGVVATCTVTVTNLTVTMGKYYGGTLGRAYYSTNNGASWTEVTSTTGTSIQVKSGDVLTFRMDPYSGYYRHPYVVNANGSYYSPSIYNGMFTVTVTENKTIKLNFSKSVPTGDTSMWQYVVAALASSGTATGVVAYVKSKTKKK